MRISYEIDETEEELAAGAYHFRFDGINYAGNGTLVIRLSNVRDYVVPPARDENLDAVLRCADSLRDVVLETMPTGLLALAVNAYSAARVRLHRGSA